MIEPCDSYKLAHQLSDCVIGVVGGGALDFDKAQETIEKFLGEKVTPLEAKLEKAVECLRENALQGLTRPLEMGEGDDGDGHYKRIAHSLIRRSARALAEIKESK